MSVGFREKNTLLDESGASISGGGVRFAMGTNGSNNGINIDDLVGHKVMFSFWIYYYDDTTLGAPETIDFVIWNRLNKTEDDLGTGYLRADKFSVPVDTWTYHEVEMEITENIPNGMFLIGTEGETANELDLLSNFFLDDITITVIE